MVVLTIPIDARVLFAPVDVASYLCCLVTEEDQEKMNEASVLHHERFLRSRMEISQLEFELKEQVWKKDMYRDLIEQQDEDLKDLLILIAELEKVQEKIDLIELLQAEMDEVKTTAEALKGRMDLLASEKEDTKKELALVKDHLRVAKYKADKWSRLNDELRAQLASNASKWDALGQEYTALKSKLEATSIDSSEVEEMLAQYKADVEIVEAHLRMKIEYVKRLSRRETLEEVHARRFDLSDEFEEAKRLEAEAKELCEPERPKALKE
ncbi:uncharacterized protein [Nicotiana tomentosiformis]|uniref:uncharacterized protein n=1 Tax=Nicotiana tomentosiformis TaxID=4098 RepID=UPI00388CAA0C